MINKIMAPVSIIISAASLVIGVYCVEGVMISASIFAISYSSVVFIKSKEGAYFWSLLMSVTILICTVLMVTLMSYGNLVENGSMTDYNWGRIVAVIHAIPVIPLTLMTFFTFAILFNASYNWAVVSGLSVFLGLGVLVPGYVILYVVQRADIDAGMIANGYVLFGLMIGLIQMIIFAVIAGHIFRNKGYVITPQGLERRS